MEALRDNNNLLALPNEEHLAKMTTGHWYALPPPDYYKYSACSVVKEDVRFYDDSTDHDTSTHGNAICTIDCLMSNKNAILPLTLFQPFSNTLSPCFFGENTPCNIALTETLRAPVDPIWSRIPECMTADMGTLTSGRWLMRNRIFDVTWSNDSIDIGTALDDSNNLYNPVYGTGIYRGPLFDPNEPRSSTWLTIIKNQNLMDYLPLLNEVNTCTLASDLNLQQITLDKCRENYIGIFGLNVGPTGTPNIIPSSLDKIPSMGGGCQYVYDISDTSGCPKIDDMCINGGLKGTWRHSLAILSPDHRLDVLPDHICQNFKPGSNTLQPSWVKPPAEANPNNLSFSGFGRQPDRGTITDTLQPQANNAYIYRSCALQNFSSSPQNCCANDFADGEGDTIFNPRDDQAPPLDQARPLAHRAPLFGYNYEAKTPWYKNCFDSNGLTCDQEFRDITSLSCSRFMVPHCAISPETTAPESWNVFATDGSCECSRWLGRLLYGSGGKWINFLTIAQNRDFLPDRTTSELSTEYLTFLTANFHKVFTMRDIYNTVNLGIPLSPLAKALEPVIFTLYKSYNLNLYDNNVLLEQCSVYTIDDVVKNPLLRKWCGCMLSSISYREKYDGISIACTPMCNSIDVIQYGPPCQGTLCVLDDVTINLIDSKAVGGVSLVQVCRSCGQVYSSDTTTVKQTCDCIIGASITAIDSTLGTVSVSEFCGNGNGNSKPNTDTRPNPKKVLESSKTVIRTFPYPLVATLVGIAIVTILGYMIAQRSRDWLRWIGLSTLIIGLILLIGIIYSIVVLSF